MTLLSVTVGVMADGITGVTLTLRHNGKSSFDYQVPATGAADIDLTAEKTTSLIIQKVVVETSGAVSDVSFVATMYTFNPEKGNDHEWRTMPLMNDGNGRWVLDMGEGVELVESDWVNKTKVFEYFVQAKGASGGDLLFNNGGNNYKCIFTTGDGDADNWKVKFYRDKTASIGLLVDGGLREYDINGSGEASPSDQPGQLSSLVINDFSLFFIYNQEQGVKVSDVSV